MVLKRKIYRHASFFTTNFIMSSLKKSNEMQQHADIYLLLNYSTCFGRPTRPSSGVRKTVVAASGPAVTTISCTPDEGRNGRPKHVE